MPSLKISSADGRPGVGDISCKSPRLPRPNGYLTKEMVSCLEQIINYKSVSGKFYSKPFLTNEIKSLVQVWKPQLKTDL